MRAAPQWTCTPRPSLAAVAARCYAPAFEAEECLHQGGGEGGDGDEYNVSLPKTDLSSAPLRQSSDTYRSGWGKHNSF